MPLILTDAQRKSFVALSDTAKSLQKLFESQPDHAALAAEARNAFSTEAGRLAKKYVLQAAKEAGVSPGVAEQHWNSISLDICRSIEEGSFFDFVGNLADPLRLTLSEMNIGALGVAANGPLILAQEGGVPFLLADTAGSPIDANSALGKALRIIDVVLELIGVLLLLINVVMPKINWGRIIEVLGERQEFGALEGIVGSLSVLGKMIADGVSKEEVLEKIIEIVKKLWTIDTVWAVIKAGLDDMHWYDWALLAAKFLGLTALEVGADWLSAGAATGIKIGVILAGGGQIALKISRLVDSAA